MNSVAVDFSIALEKSIPPHTSRECGFCYSGCDKI